MNQSKIGRTALFGWSLTSALLASTMLAGPPARAADADATAADASAAQTGEIIVTAEKREESLQSVAMSVQAIDTKHLDQLNINGFGDYVKFMPAVTFQTTGPNQTTLYMRGISSGDNANHSGPLPSVGSYLDELPISTIGGTLDVHIYDVARIEVLPGPQGTLYGASSEAGTMRIITNKPSTDGFSAAYDLQGNYEDHAGEGYVAEGYVNVPLAQNVAVRIVAWDEHDPGDIANVPGTRTFATSGATVNNAPFVDAHSNPADTFGGRAALKIDLNDNWTVTPSIIGQYLNTKGFYGFEPSVGDLQDQRFQPDTDKDGWIQAALTVNGKIGNYDLTYAGGYFWRDVETKDDYTDYSIQYDAYYGSGANWQDSSGNPLQTPLQEIIGRDRFSKESNEIRIASPATDRFRFIAGAFQEVQTHWIIQDYQIQGFGPQISPPGWPGTIWLTDELRTDRDEAVFAEASFDITPQLTLTGGIRGYGYDNSLYGFFGFGEGYNALTGFSSGMGDTGQNCHAGKTFETAPCVNLDKSQTGSGETHKINLNYKIDSNHLVYFTYSTGYRPGGNNRNGNFGPYAADYLTNYEAGWKTSWFDRSLIFDGSVYYEDWSNFQFSYLGPNSLTIIQNAPSARVIGVEASVDYHPDDHLTLSAGANYNDAQLTKNFCVDPVSGLVIPTCSDADATAVHGAQLPFTPPFKAEMTARYAWDVGGWRAHIQGSGTFQSRNQVGLRVSDIVLLGSMPSFETADFDVGVDKDKIRLDLFVKNAFDSRGQVDRFTPCTVSVCLAPVGTAPRPLYVIPIQPMTVGIKVGESF
jgi:outer membrane receptor protein involved in Fe transport